jgi:hypothetical protein
MSAVPCAKATTICDMNGNISKHGIVYIKDGFGPVFLTQLSSPNLRPLDDASTGQFEHDAERRYAKRHRCERQ